MYDEERSFERLFEQLSTQSLKRSLEQALEQPFKRPKDRLTDLHAEPLFELLINKSIVRNIFKWLSMMMYIIIIIIATSKYFKQLIYLSIVQTVVWRVDRSVNCLVA